MYQPCSSLEAAVDSGRPAEEIRVEGEGGACVRGKRYMLKVWQPGLFHDDESCM